MGIGGGGGAYGVYHNGLRSFVQFGRELFWQISGIFMGMSPCTLVSVTLLETCGNTGHDQYRSEWPRVINNGILRMIYETTY